MKQDSNVKRVLKDDGVTDSLLVAGHQFENPRLASSLEDYITIT